MVRPALLILASITLLVACSEKESHTIPKVAPALETQVIEHSVNKTQEHDDIDPQPSDQSPEMDISPNAEDIVLGSAEPAVPQGSEEAAEVVIDAVDELSSMEQASDTGQNVDSVANAGTQYTVKAGDTLGRIALSQGVTVDSIVRANNISDKNTIRVGQQLAIE